MSDDLNLLRNLGNTQHSDLLAGVDLAAGLPVFSLRWLDRAFDACFGTEAKLTDSFVPRPPHWRR